MSTPSTRRIETDSSSASSIDMDVDQVVVSEKDNRAATLGSDTGRLQGRTARQVRTSEPKNKPKSRQRDSIPSEPPRDTRISRGKDLIKEGGKNKTREAPSSTQTEGCGWKKIIALVAVIFTIITLAGGVIGLLSYIGILQLGLAGIGAMSSTTAFYLMLAGLGLAFLTTVLTGVAWSLNRSRSPEEGGCCPTGSKNQNPNERLHKEKKPV